MGLVEFGAGWALGAKAGERGFDEVVEAARSIVHSQEVKDLVAALRSHAGHSLKELGALVGGDTAAGGEDLLDLVRNLVERAEGATPGEGFAPLRIVRDALRDRGAPS